MGESGSAQVSAEAQQLHNGSVVIQLDSENLQVIFAVLESKNVPPIVFDLKKGLILNAAFPT
jgi:hypothetical protein